MERLGRFLGAFLSIMLFMGIYSIAEEITLTTYYPAPYGAYNELTTTGNTYLATTLGNVGIGLVATDTIQNKLDVEGSVAIGAGYSGTSPAAPPNGLIVQGQVGIGTASPTVGIALDVNGTINATDYSAGGVVGVTTTIQGWDAGSGQWKTITITNGIITDVH
jgi:hypothetical protein